MVYRAKPSRPAPEFIVDRRGRVSTRSSAARRTRNWKAASAALILLVAAPVGGLGEAARVASVSAATAARDFIAMRSPGRRLRAEMTKGKFVRRAPVARAKPAARHRPARATLAHRVLPKLLTAPSERLPLVFLDEPFEAPRLDFASLAPGLIEEEQACLCTFAPEPRPIGGGVFFSPGPGGGLLPPLPGGGPPLQPAPSIPEPSTWGMMIVGFAAMGTAWRRRRWSKQVASAGRMRLGINPLVPNASADLSIPHSQLWAGREDA